MNELKFSKTKQAKQIPRYILRGSKFNNTPSQYKGRLYHSRFEAEYAIILDDMLKNKEIDSWTPQFKLRLDINGKHICNYVADFLVKRGRFLEIHETKGYFSPISKIKWKLAIALYSDKYQFKLIR